MLPGCCLTARRDAWLALGGFDQVFFLYWEDVELCWRAWLLGWRVVTARQSWVYHQKGATTTAFGRWDGERTRNSLYTYLKLMRWQIALAYAVRLFIVCCVKGVRWPILAPDLLKAWAWNIKQFPATMRSRRAIRSRRVGDDRWLEQQIRLQEQALRKERNQIKSRCYR